MYAVIRTGGKQYKVAKDDVIRVERLAAEPGASVSLEEVLLIGGDKAPAVGTPVVAGASVSATVLEQTKGAKVLVFKKKRRKNYRRRRGHRQHLTVLRIDEILPAGARPSARKKAAAAPEKETARTPAARAKPAARKTPAAKAKPAKEKAKAAKPAARKTTKTTAKPAKPAKTAKPAKGKATSGRGRTTKAKGAKQAKEKT